MSAVAGFVCAFRGARDRYQAPLALAEAGRLDQFITDVYTTPLIRRLGSSIVGARTSARFEPGIPDDRVSCLWGTALLEQARHRLRYSPRRATVARIMLFCVARSAGRFVRRAARCRRILRSEIQPRRKRGVPRPS